MSHMYKFNFLNKINQAKLEEKRRNRFMALIFVITNLSLVFLLGMIYLQSSSINHDYSRALALNKKLNDKIVKFRKDFFPFRKIQNIYNLETNRKKTTLILSVIEASIDTTVIIENYQYDGNVLDIRFLTRSSGSKSVLMTNANAIKTKINDKLVELNYIKNKKTVQLEKGPDIKKSYQDFQYWNYDFKIDLSPAVVKRKADPKLEVPMEPTK